MTVSKNVRVWLATVVALLVLIPCSFGRAVPKTTTPAARRSRTPRRYTKSRHHRSATHRKSSRSHRRRRRSASTGSSFHQRFSKIHPQPGRVDQIQEALIASGELHGQPTGVWDQATRSAMSHYQAANGFPVTGKPDAKSLMKLGLGPHPLPESLANTRPETGPGAGAEASSEPTASAVKSSSAPPE